MFFYEVLLMSRKPVAKELKKKVKEVLKALRIKGRYNDVKYKDRYIESPQGKVF